MSGVPVLPGAALVDDATSLELRDALQLGHDVRVGRHEMHMTDPVVVLVDSREQLPLDFGPVPTRRVTLAEDDYTAEGVEDVVRIERKGPDLLQAVGHERERPERELVRLEAFPVRAIVIEDQTSSIFAGAWTCPSMLTSRHVVGSLCAWSMRHGIAILPVGDRLTAARLVYSILRRAVLDAASGRAAAAR